MYIFHCRKSFLDRNEQHHENEPGEAFIWTVKILLLWQVYRNKQAHDVFWSVHL